MFTCWWDAPHMPPILPSRTRYSLPQLRQRLASSTTTSNKTANNNINRNNNSIASEQTRRRFQMGRHRHRALVESPEIPSPGILPPLPGVLLHAKEEQWNGHIAGDPIPVVVIPDFRRRMAVTAEATAPTSNRDAASAATVCNGTRKSDRS